MNIHESTRLYEDWLQRQLKGDVVISDLARKHEKMKEGPFVFLRATYWRWAENILDVCPDLAGASGGARRWRLSSGELRNLARR